MISRTHTLTLIVYTRLPFLPDCFRSRVMPQNILGVTVVNITADKKCSYSRSIYIVYMLQWYRMFKNKGEKSQRSAKHENTLCIWHYNHKIVRVHACVHLSCHGRSPEDDLTLCPWLVFRSIEKPGCTGDGRTESAWMRMASMSSYVGIWRDQVAHLEMTAYSELPKSNKEESRLVRPW